MSWKSGDGEFNLSANESGGQRLSQHEIINR